MMVARASCYAPGALAETDSQLLRSWRGRPWWSPLRNPQAGAVSPSIHV
ncbi:MAG TPA: hypothetical protein VFQ30_17320 [Ktedonobacteraceae bacterium]|nr:hypothetical protein [Ktedonobacteraceae bacterium]